MKDEDCKGGSTHCTSVPPASCSGGCVSAAIHRYRGGFASRRELPVRVGVERKFFRYNPRSSSTNSSLSGCSTTVHKRHVIAEEPIESREHLASCMVGSSSVTAH